MRIRGLSAVLALAVLAAPLYADHAPSKRKTDKAGAARVADRLVSLGMDKTAAELQVSVLTDKEIAYFAADLSRVQVVGAQGDNWNGEADLIWYEAIIGLAMIAGSLTWIFFAQQN